MMRPREMAVLLFLAGCALTDLRDRRIRLWFAVCFLVLGIACGTTGAFVGTAGAIGGAAETYEGTAAAIGGTGEALDGVIEVSGGAGLAMLPGAVVLALAVVSGGRIGCGDGIALIVAGLYLDVGSILAALLCALLLSSLFAGAVLVLTHRRKFSYPFLPFLLAGYLLSWTI